MRDELLHGAPAKSARHPWSGWLPWVIVSVVVIAWTNLKIANIGAHAIPWPGLNKAISITLYNAKPYPPVFAFPPLTTVTAILLSALLTGLLGKLSPLSMLAALGQTLRQIFLPTVTVVSIVALAFLMNYSGLAYTLGAGVAATGGFFVILSPFLGWIAVMLSGSDTSGNALFGNLQVVAAKQLSLSPVLFAATNSAGGVMGKIISPQNISTGCSVTGMNGHEGKVFARVFIHSVVLTLALAGLVAAIQFLIPWVIPHQG